MELEDLESKNYIPTVQCTTIEGQKITFGAAASKPALLVFFTTWCSSCIEAAPAISRQFEHLKDQINLIGIGREHNAAELMTFKEEEQLAYHLVEDPERALFNEFAKMHVPRIYLVDTKGNVRYQDVNWHPFMLEDMQEAVDCLLQKPS
jgi:peroxiredoxin